MEAGRNLLSSPPTFPSRTHFKNCHPSSSTSCSVLMLHEQAAPALAPMTTTSLARHFPTSVLLQEQRDENRPLLYMAKEERTSQATLDRRMEDGSSAHEENDNVGSDQYLEDFQCQLLKCPGLWYLVPSLQTGERRSLFSSMQFFLSKTKNRTNVEPNDVLALAQQALSASKEAALLAENSKLFGAYLEESVTPSSRSTGLPDAPIKEVKMVRSTRLQERRSKKRTQPKPPVILQDTSSSKRKDVKRKISEGFDPNDPLRLFLWGPETRKLLTAKEESELIVQIQDLMRLEEVKSKLHSQFDRVPTLVEWAEAVGLSSRALQSQLHRGNYSRDKLIYANFRMVVHISMQYLGRGLSLQDLLQEGSKGLMRSVEKFKPQAGTRFATYAYWWIRHTVRKAIFQHSRTIRLPDNVYALLHKVAEAKRSCIGEGLNHPTKEEIAARAGITVQKMESLLCAARMPLSMQQPVWTDQDTTFQEITADTAIEIPEMSVSKQFMRQHIRNLLGVLCPKERRIIRLRYGIESDKPNSLSEIGAVFGLSKERVRQLESRALNKLKQYLSPQGLGSYADLLI